MRSEGLSSFCNGCGDGNIRCNGRGKTSPPTKSEWDSADAKPYKHAQTLAIRKGQCYSTNAKSYRHANARSAKNNTI